MNDDVDISMSVNNIFEIFTIVKILKTLNIFYYYKVMTQDFKCKILL